MHALLDTNDGRSIIGANFPFGGRPLNIMATSRRAWRKVTTRLSGIMAGRGDVSRRPPSGGLPLSRFSSAQDFQQSELGSAIWKERVTALEQARVRHGNAFTVTAFCHVCNRWEPLQVDYLFGGDASRLAPNWRERLVCPSCGFNNRMRAAIQVFEEECQPRADSTIYLTEQVTPLFEHFRRRYRQVIGSEYLSSDMAPGSVSRLGIRHESLTRMSFRDASLDFILSFDVLEHIPDYQAALRECLRCLRPGGRLLLSAPFVMDSKENLIRARETEGGDVIHLMPPEYHGDPMSEEGCLCYQHFGWALLDDLRTAGFTQVQALVYWSVDYGYLGGPQLFVTGVRA